MEAVEADDIVAPARQEDTLEAAAAVAGQAAVAAAAADDVVPTGPLPIGTIPKFTKTERCCPS